MDLAQLLIGYEKGLLLLWDVMAKGVLVQFDTSAASVPKCMTWLPDNTMFKTGHDDGKVECWSIKSPTALESEGEDTFEFCEPVTNISAYQNSGTTMLVHDGGELSRSSRSSVSPDRPPTHPPPHPQLQFGSIQIRRPLPFRYPMFQLSPALSSDLIICRVRCSFYCRPNSFATSHSFSDRREERTANKAAVHRPDHCPRMPLERSMAAGMCDKLHRITRQTCPPPSSLSLPDLQTDA